MLNVLKQLLLKEGDFPLYFYPLKVLLITNRQQLDIPLPRKVCFDINNKDLLDSKKLDQFDDWIFLDWKLILLGYPFRFFWIEDLFLRESFLIILTLWLNCGFLTILILT